MGRPGEQPGAPHTTQHVPYLAAFAAAAAAGAPTPGDKGERDTQPPAPMPPQSWAVGTGLLGIVTCNPGDTSNTGHQARDAANAGHKAWDATNPGQHPWTWREAEQSDPSQNTLVLLVGTWSVPVSREALGHPALRWALHTSQTSCSGDLGCTQDWDSQLLTPKPGVWSPPSHPGAWVPPRFPKAVVVNPSSSCSSCVSSGCSNELLFATHLSLTKQPNKGSSKHEICITLP